jgi:lysyl-tRNA synthetase class 2
MADADRIEKLNQIKKLGINPYPYSFNQTHHASDIANKFAELENKKVAVAGRVMSIREHGKLAFIDLHDTSGKIQIWISEDNVGKKLFDLLHLIERGDFVGVNGTVVKTKRGEISVKANSFEILTKSLRHLPSTWFGLKDTELRYRMRYVDLILNPEVRKLFVIRTKIIDAIREFLNERKYLEVETPILQMIYGGAAAHPFETYIRDLKLKVYLRTSNELYLKRLLVGGFERVYEFSKDFRNESIDSTHNPEFTIVESYEAYADRDKIADLFEQLYAYVAKKVLGTTKIVFQGKTIDVGKWKRVKMTDAIKEKYKIDVLKMSKKELEKFAREKKAEITGDETEGELINAIFETFDKEIFEPTLIMDHPIETTPLCKPDRNDKSARFVERFEPYIAGMELGNAYSELNDPILQRKLLEQQLGTRCIAKEAWTCELDEDFVRALEYGMPPTGGIGISIDRMTMLFTDNPSIKEVIFFPFMAPTPEELHKHKKGEKKEEKKSKKKEK